MQTHFPDESKMDYDPDRLLYLMTLIHNGKEEDALAIIKKPARINIDVFFRAECLAIATHISAVGATVNK